MIDWLEALYAGGSGAVVVGCILCAVCAIRALTRRATRRAVVFGTLSLVLAAAIIIGAPLLKTLYKERQAQVFEQGIMGLPAFKVVVDHDPAVKETLLKFEEMIRREQITEDQATDALIHEIVQAYFSYVAITSDRAITEYTFAYLGALETLDQKSPQLCADFVNNKGRGGTAHYLHREEKNRLLAAMAQVVEDAIKTPQSGGSLSEVTQRLDPILKRIGITGGQVALFRIMQDPDPEKVCSTVEALYRAVLPLPSHEASLLLRAIFSRRLAQSTHL